MTRPSIPSLAASVAIAAAIGAGCQANNKAHNTAHNTANQNAGADHSGHNMSNMNGHDMSDMQSAPNAAAQPFDLQFIDTMIHHHDGALEMAKDILTKTQRQELKTFAQKIIDDQTKEIAMMRDWREKWYAGKPSALNMELPGMKMSESAEDRVADADQEFLRMMIEHHEGALLMGEAAIKRGEHPEIKQLGEDVIKAQRSEIEKMKAWQEEWAAK